VKWPCQNSVSFSCSECGPNVIRFIHQPQALSDVKPGVTIMANPSPNAEGKLTSGFNQIEFSGHKPIDLD